MNVPTKVHDDQQHLEEFKALIGPLKTLHKILQQKKREENARKARDEEATREYDAHMKLYEVDHKARQKEQEEARKASLQETWRVYEARRKDAEQEHEAYLQEAKLEYEARQVEAQLEYEKKLKRQNKRKKKPLPCRFFPLGTCWNGDDCRFRHETE
mmetsp:Transcript_21915/g.54122  ORF Transcript_21915/g.54122 Transcript_21915/m.54122 type:complete len:157 (-) Transcript_21915:843-1313(-)